MLDPADFETRPWIPNSGWPFGRAHLSPYYDRACDLLQIPRFDFDPAAPREPSRPPLPIGDGRTFTTVARQHSRLTGIPFKVSFPRQRESRGRQLRTCADRALDSRVRGNDARFLRTDTLKGVRLTGQRHEGKHYAEFKDGVVRGRAVRAYVNANVTDITAAPDGRSVESLAVATLDGKRHRARARRYVLAAGGLENVRLLLASDGVHRAGLGNAHALVGRYFGGHVTYWMDDTPASPASSAYFSRPVESLDLYTSRDVYKTWGVLALTLDAQRRERLPNLTVTLFPPARTVAPREREVARLAALADRALPAAGDDELALGRRYVPLYFMGEQAPHPESRVRLAEERDALGMRRLHVDWRFDAADFDGLRRGIRLFARELGATGTGRLAWDFERSDFLAMMNMSRHHIGTTRMHPDPRLGVVDAQCRLHGVGNLYVAGSSVFPTGGIANPTLTLLALALRLSDHLKRELRA